MGNASDIGQTLLDSTKVCSAQYSFSFLLFWVVSWESYGFDLYIYKVRKITFTGSTAVGKKLMAGSASTVKKVNLPF